MWPFFPCGAPEVGVYDAAGRELDRKARGSDRAAMEGCALGLEID